MANRLRSRRAPLARTGVLCLAVVACQPAFALAQPVPPARLSVSTAGTEANGKSTVLAVSDDGRHVLFYSEATNLVAGDTNGTIDLFVRDRDTDRDGVLDEPGAVLTVRVSEGLSGQQDSAPQGTPSMSADGRFVLFDALAALDPGDTNGVQDVYLRDRDADGDGIFDEPGAVTLSVVSRGTGNVQGNGASRAASMTRDGRFVVFLSNATVFGVPGIPQWFRKDLSSGVLTMITTRPSGAPADTLAQTPALSPDGRYAVFVGGFLDITGGPPTFSATPWVLRDLVENTLTPIAIPATTPSVLPAAAPTRIAGALTTIEYGNSFGFAPDGRTVYLTETTTDTPSAFTTITGSILEYDVVAKRVTKRFPGLPNGLNLYGQGFRGGTSFVYAESSGNDGCLIPDALSVARYDTVTRRVTTVVGGRVRSFFGNAAGRSVVRVSQCPFGGGTATYLLDDAYGGAPLDLEDPPVRPGLMDAAGRMVIYDTPDADILAAGVDTNGVNDVFAVDIPSRLDRDADGLDDRWERAMDLSTTDGTGINGPAGDPDGDGRTNQQEFEAGTHPRGLTRQFLAEGADNAFFKTRLAIANNGVSGTTAVVRFDGDDGTAKSINVYVPAFARRTVFVDEVSGRSASFSTVVESSRPLVAERTMSWDATAYGAHAEHATASPATTWFLAEGATDPFSLFYLLQNPNGAAATATVRYLRPAPLPPITRTYTLAAHSRTTIPVNTQAPELAATDVSASITSSQPILVERAMYRTVGTQLFAAGDASAGVTAPATSWFLAEGATGPFFDLFILLANPGTTDANVDIRYLLPDGTVLTKSYTVAAESRRTIWVDGEEFPGVGRALANVAVSSTITVTNAVPIVVERTMWFPGPEITPEFWTEANSSAGATATAAGWVLADGESGGTRDVQTFVLIANTASVAQGVRVFQLPDAPNFYPGPAPFFDLTLPPNSRTTVALHTLPGWTNKRYGVLVSAFDPPFQPNLVVERSMYWNANGVVWAAGTNLLATPLP